MLESDLYPPLKRVLEAMDFEVKGEVEDCDVVAIRGKEAPVVVELKRSINLTALLQAVDRFAYSPNVYVGVPRDVSALRKERKRILKLFRRLGLGLILIDPGGTRKSAVEIVLDPVPSAPRPNKKRTARLMKEFHTRIGDTIPGGSRAQGARLTAYRQRAIRIAAHLEKVGPKKASVIAAELSEPTARDVLYRNVYGWFLGEGKGIYRLSERGAVELGEWRG
jgi:hypothetical protein